MFKGTTGSLKEESKEEEELTSASRDTHTILYQIPNVPHAFSSRREAQKRITKEFFREGDIPF